MRLPKKQGGLYKIPRGRRRGIKGTKIYLTAKRAWGNESLQGNKPPRRKRRGVKKGQGVDWLTRQTAGNGTLGVFNAATGISNPAPWAAL